MMPPIMNDISRYQRCITIFLNEGGKCIKKVVRSIFLLTAHFMEPQQVHSCQKKLEMCSREQFVTEKVKYLK